MGYQNKLLKNGRVWGILIGIIAFIVVVVWRHLTR
jgi:t-SNARE complex subunit (syntaxin)